MGRQAEAFWQFILNRRLDHDVLAERRPLLRELSELAELALEDDMRRMERHGSE